MSRQLLRIQLLTNEVSGYDTAIYYVTENRLRNCLGRKHNHSNLCPTHMEAYAKDSQL